MIFEFSVNPAFNFLTSFAEKLKVTVHKNRLIIPSSLGQGYIKTIDVSADLKFVMHCYKLNQTFQLKRLANEGKNNMISIVFNSHEIPSDHTADQESAIRFLKTNGSAIQIASSSLGTESFFPSNSEVHFAVISIKSQLLASLLQIEKPNKLIETILASDSSFFYHENMTAETQRILKQLSDINEHNELNYLLHRIKILELLSLLFGQLMQRGSDRQSAVNKGDIESLYTIKASIIADLSKPPLLNELAKSAGMSETKMKQLFKQVFGDTIYNFYQKLRMEEAAFMLRQARYSVSEAGYKLGFSNLSHFSRLFQKHYGEKPKKYSNG